LGKTARRLRVGRQARKPPRKVVARRLADALESPVSVRFGQGKSEALLARMLRARATAHKRSFSDQLKYYAHVGMIAEDNPDLPLSMIQGILEAQAELEAGLGQPYQWGVIESSD
jgi:hypothetical protein